MFIYLKILRTQDGGLMQNLNNLKRAIILMLFFFISSNLSFSYPTAPLLGTAAT